MCYYIETYKEDPSECLFLKGLKTFYMVDPLSDTTPKRLMHVDLFCLLNWSNNKLVTRFYPKQRASASEASFIVSLMGTCWMS